MSSIDYNELFEQYYQNEYDFNTASLSLDEIAEIKKLAREKRVDYNLAPMGTGVFNWILKENSNIRFERVAFDSEKIDGMLYVPATGKERAYIILNSKKPLINQIFTAAHEYYHYIVRLKTWRNSILNLYLKASRTFISTKRSIRNWMMNPGLSTGG